jgi:hypothetical protein
MPSTEWSENEAQKLDNRALSSVRGPTHAILLEASLQPGRCQLRLSERDDLAVPQRRWRSGRREQQI